MPPTPDDPGIIAEQALDATEQTVSDARNQLEESRQAQLAQADSAAERAAINAQFAELRSQFEGLNNGIDSRLSNMQQSILDEMRSMMQPTTPSAMAGEGDTAFDDLIESIEEIADDGLEGATDLAVGAADTAEQAVRDVVPQRTHFMHKKWFGGKAD